MKRTHFVQTMSIACAMTLLSLPLMADTISFDGTTDNTWTGANWTINAGTPGSVVPNDGVSNTIGYSYNGDDWDIDSSTVSEDVQIKLDGGTLDISNSNVSLVPSSANTGAALSGLNLGQSGNATVSTLTNSTLTAGRSNQNGNALRLRNGSSLDVVNSTINVDAEPGSGNFTVEHSSTLTLDADSTVNITGGLEVTSNAANVTFNNATLSAAWLRLNSGGEASQELMLDFLGGNITLTNSNPLRDNSSFEGAFDWIGGAGSGSIIHTNATDINQTLAQKTFQGYFSINGTRINPSTNPSVDGIAALNAELQTLAVGGEYFEIIDGGTTQTLVLVVPEPSSMILLGLACVSAFAAHRKS